MFPKVELDNLFVYLSLKKIIKTINSIFNNKKKTEADILKPLLHPGGHSALRGCKEDKFKNYLCKYSNESTEDKNYMRTGVKTGTPS